MLNLIPCESPAAKTGRMRGFSPREQSWVVSDLQSKWHIQRVLLQAHGVLEERAVLRATELWKQLAFQLRPDLKTISVELAQSLFWNWIEPRGLEWARSPRAVNVVMDQMGQWMSLFADPQHPEIMAEWFTANPEAYVRWGHWFELCSEIWSRCEEQNVVMTSWLPAVLLSEDLSSVQLGRKLTFDLGPQISLVESQLIRELSKTHEVDVIFPAADWMAMMPGPLRPYTEVLGARLPTEKSDWQPALNPQFQFRRLSTQLAEVKDTVARVRSWLDAGVPASQIAIVAPDIEQHWPTLRLYLEQEGIPVNKSLQARLGGFLEMSHWIASLRTRLGKVSSGDLETHFFAGVDQPPLSVDEFRVLFTHVFGAHDLARAERLFASGASIESQSDAGVRDFLVWAMQSWRSGRPTERLLHLLQIVGQEVPVHVALPAVEWLSYLEGLLARREMSLTPAHEAGVACVSLSSANWLEVSHAVIMNLCENDLRYLQTSQVSTGEALKIFNDTGFALSSVDRQELEFELLWLWERPWTELQLSFAETDFSGSVLTPSRLWMWSGIVHQKWQKTPQVAQSTRWDEIQRLDFEGWARARDLEMTEEGRLWSQRLALGLKRDVDASVSTWKPLENLRISASSLERYFECPFVFAAQRLFKLLDQPLLDLDLDQRTRGQLLHALLEELLREPMRLDRTTEEISALVDEVRLKSDLRLGEEALWPAVRAQHIRLVQMFLEMEREMRARFGSARTLSVETEFNCNWDLQTGGPVEAGHSTPIQLAGRIDRVDVDSAGRYALIDYKASAANVRNWASWLQAHDLQMPLYAMLLESGLTAHPASPVAAANFYVVKDRERRKGYHVKEESAELYSLEDKHRNWITPEQKQQLFLELREQIQGALQRMMQGDFNPRPETTRTCETCNWRTLCRAPHLN